MKELDKIVAQLESAEDSVATMDAIVGSRDWFDCEVLASAIKEELDEFSGEIERSLRILKGKLIKKAACHVTTVIEFHGLYPSCVSQ